MCRFVQFFLPLLLFIDFDVTFSQPCSSTIDLSSKRVERSQESYPPTRNSLNSFMRTGRSLEEPIIPLGQDKVYTIFPFFRTGRVQKNTDNKRPFRSGFINRMRIGRSLPVESLANDLDILNKWLMSKYSLDISDIISLTNPSFNNEKSQWTE